MAVTTKTLTPTNQVVNLPDMTERPNASVMVDGISKEADAINVLNTDIKNQGKSPTKYICSNLDAIKTNITTIINLMSDNEERDIILEMSQPISPFSGGYWHTRLFKTNNNYFSGYATSYTTTRDMIYIQYQNGTWKIEQFALKNDVSNLASKFDVKTGTTSFQSLDPNGTGHPEYMGGTLDAKIYSSISNFDSLKSTPFCVGNGGPQYGGILTKISNDYFCGIVYSYHDSAMYVPWYFGYSNGTFILRPLGPV